MTESELKELENFAIKETKRILERRNTPVKKSNLDKHTYQRNDGNVVFVNFKRLRKD